MTASIFFLKIDENLHNFDYERMQKFENPFYKKCVLAWQINIPGMNFKVSSELHSCASKQYSAKEVAKWLELQDYNICDTMVFK